MNTQKLLQTSIEIMIRYYNNDIEMALSKFHSDILWVGPMQGQIIRSKKLLVDTFRKDINTMTFNLFDMNGQIVYSTSKQCDILLTYMVDSFYPDKSVIRCNQHIFFSWVPEKTEQPDGSIILEPKIRTCLISNTMPHDERDCIYPNHFTSTSLTKYYILSTAGKHFATKGRHSEKLYFDENEIIYVESNRPGCIIHTTISSFECAESVSEIYKKGGDSLIRIHSSYLINPMYIRSIHRFAVTLQNGCVLPVPEKKYTAIKAQITEYLESAT